MNRVSQAKSKGYAGKPTVAATLNGKGYFGQWQTVVALGSALRTTSRDGHGGATCNTCRGCRKVLQPQGLGPPMSNTEHEFTDTNRHLVEVPDTFAIARWPRDADVATIARCILGTLKYEPHAADTAALRRALESVIDHAQRASSTAA